MHSSHKLAFTIAGAIFAIWLAFMGFAISASVLPEERSGIVLAVFKPGISPDTAFNIILAAGGNPIRPTWLGFVWTAQGNSAGFVGRLKQFGAVAALEEFPFSPQLGGCFVFRKNLRSPLSLKNTLP